MSNPLLPCPFCGGEADIEEIPGSPFTNETYMWAVGCKDCNIGWYKETKAEAIAAWNRRVDARQLALKTRVCPMCEDCPDGCPVETPKDSRNIVTNADRIRAMTDEELAKIITSDLIGELILFCQNKYECVAMLSINTIPEEWCMQCALDWLKQPAKEET